MIRRSRRREERRQHDEVEVAGLFLGCNGVYSALTPRMWGRFTNNASSPPSWTRLPFLFEVFRLYMFARVSTSLPKSTSITRASRVALKHKTAPFPIHLFSTSSNMTTNGMNIPEIEKKAQSFSGPDTKVNNWSQPGPAAFDFRSVFPLPCRILLSLTTQSPFLQAM